MNHKRVDIKFALNGCRICAGAILEDRDLYLGIINALSNRELIEKRLEEYFERKRLEEITK